MERLISNLTLQLNNETIAYVPNTLEFTPTTAKHTVKTVTTGGTTSTAVVSTDLTEALAKVSFEVRLTKQTIDNIKTWFNQANFIGLSSADGEVVEAFNSMTLVEIPPYKFGADKSITLEFLGDAK